MSDSRRRSAAVLGWLLSLILFLQAGTSVQAEGENFLDEMRGGVELSLIHISLPTIA